jgi:hypothetical protein
MKYEILDIFSRYTTLVSFICKFTLGRITRLNGKLEMMENNLARFYLGVDFLFLFHQGKRKEA